MMKNNILILILLGFLIVGCSEDNSSESQIDETEESKDEYYIEDPKKASIVEVTPVNWYVRIIVEDSSRGLRTEASQLGELNVSDAVTEHTLKSLAPFGSNFVDVVFIDPLGVDKGEYKTNFHVYQDGVEDRWEFTIKTDDSNADMTLSWRGLYILTPYIDAEDRQRYKEYRSLTNPLLKQMKLIDSLTLVEVPVINDGKVYTYTFNMDGKETRTFEWVVLAEEVEIPLPSVKLPSARSSSFRTEQQDLKENIDLSKSDQFDLNKPPSFKELN